MNMNHARKSAFSSRVQIPRLIMNTNTVVPSRDYLDADGTIADSNSIPKSMVMYESKQLSTMPSKNIVNIASRLLNYCISFWMIKRRHDATVLTRMYYMAVLWPNLSRQKPMIWGPKTMPRPRATYVRIAIAIFSSSDISLFILMPFASFVSMIRCT